MNIPFLNRQNFEIKNRIPELNNDKIIRIIVLIGTTIYMIINCFYGQASVHHKVSCIEDMTHYLTQRINTFFLNNKKYNFILKLFFSILIDFSIIYTLIIWSLYGSNIRLLSTGISFMAFNIMCRFIHIQIQPSNSSFYEKHFFSIFINYQKTSYTFFPIIIGLLLICAFEWKRNNNYYIFIYFIFLFISESIILIVMQGNYFHEIFTSAVTGHYFFIINESILRACFGENYLNNQIDNIYNENYEENFNINDDKKDKLKRKAEKVKIELIKMNK